jgi:arylsulfatase A-like enzyme/Flp pilus assembly protein TadD
VNRRANPSARRRAIAAVVVAAVAIGAIVATFASRRPSSLMPSGTSVLIVTVDTLRPDALAASGASFEHTVTTVPLTLPAHTSLFTGLYPVRSGVHDNGQPLGMGVPTLAEAFAANGYATGAFVSGFVLKKEFGLDRGFGHYDDTLPLGQEGWLERRAAETVGTATEWLGKQKQPWFLWVHFYDAHSPYDPPREFWQPGPRGAYDGEVASVDAALETLLAAARAQSADRLLVVLTADHGEAFGEHGESEHGYFIYDTTTVVPMIISYPGQIAAGARSLQPRLIDIAPTLLEMFGIAPPPVVDGTSLAGYLRGEKLDLPPAYVESEFPWITYGWAPLFGARTPDWKYIDAPKPELYALDADAAEATNLVASKKDIATRLQGEVDRQRIQKPLAATTVTTDPEALSKLHSLGYLGAGGTHGEAPEGLPDPKDQIALRTLATNAETLVRAGRLDEARRLFDDVLRTDPDNRYVVLRAGMAALRQNDVDAAVRLLTHAVKIAPQQAEAHYALADALTRAKRYDDAVPEWMETIRMQPRRYAAWANLGSVLAWKGEPERAIAAYAEAVALRPDDPALLGNLGEAEATFGKKSEALGHLRAAAKFEAEATTRASRIGVIAAELGERDDAIAWLRRARPSETGYARGQLELAALLVDSARDEASAALSRAIDSDPALRDEAAGRPNLAPLLK